MAGDLSTEQALRNLGLFLLQMAETTAVLAVQTASALLHEAEVFLLEQKKNMLNQVANWLNESYRGLKILAIVAVTGLVIAGAAAIATIIAGEITIKAVFAALKTAQGVFSLRLAYGVLKAVWDIIAEVSPEVKALQTRFFEFADAFDSTFGLPVHTIAGFALGFKNYVTALYSMTGLPPNLALVDTMTRITEWLSKADSSFKEYAKHPGKFFDLIFSAAIAIDETDASGLSLETLGRLDKAVEDIGSLDTKYTEVREAIDDMIEAFPTEISETIATQAGPYLTWIDTTLKPLLEQLSTAADNVDEVIDAAIEAAKVPLEDDIGKLKTKIASLASWLGIQVPDTYDVRNGMQDLFAGQILPTYLVWNVKDVIRDLTARFAVKEIPPVEMTPANDDRVSLVRQYNLPPSKTVNTWMVTLAYLAPPGKPLWYVEEN